MIIKILVQNNVQGIFLLIFKKKTREVRMKKRYFLIILLTFFLSACSGNEANEVVVYNAGEYMDMDLVEQFEEDTGIEVIYETFTSDEEMFVKLTQSANNYDVVIPMDYMVEKLLKYDMLEPIDFNNVPNVKYIMDDYKNLSFDPEGKFTVPYFSSSFGIVYNTDMVDEPIDSWADLWDPKYKGEIIMYDLPRLSMSVALQKLGYSINTTNMDEINEATEELVKQKPLVYAYLTDEARDVIVQGDAIMSVMYSGDALLMSTENENLKYVMPKEGGNLQIDSFAIPKGAKNKKNAEIFINYFTDPEISAANAEWMEGFTSPVEGVREMLPDYIANSDEAYPDPEALPPIEVFKDLEEYMEVYNNAWVRVLASY